MARLLSSSSSSPKADRGGGGGGGNDGGGVRSTILWVACCGIGFLLGRLSLENPAQLMMMGYTTTGSGTTSGTNNNDVKSLISMIANLQEQLTQLQTKLDEGCVGNNGTSTTTTTTTTRGDDKRSTTTTSNNHYAYKPPDVPPERMKDMHTITTVDIAGLEVCHNTLSRGFEPIFDSLMGLIFREPGFLPLEGGVLDVGAQFAEQSCHYGSINPHRKVFTIDPSPSNQQFANETFKPFMPNMVLGQHGLGSAMGEMRTGGSFFNMPKFGTLIQIKTVDSLFLEAGEKLAFAHIDVEGMELEVLKGGTKTILQDRPVFTTEIRVHRDANYTRTLFDFIANLGYDSYVVNEVCGTPFMDYRNVLNIPREISGKLVHSDAFSLALATESIFRITSTTIFELVYPCCAPFASCCPNGDQVDRPRMGCCSERAVNQYLQENPSASAIAIPAASKDWTAAYHLTLQRWKELEERASPLLVNNRKK